MTTQILVVDAHPWSGRFCSALADSYAAGARDGGAEVQIVALRDCGLSRGVFDSEALSEIWKQIESSSHLCFVFPNWWGGHPALLQSFFEQIMLPGKAFNYRRDGRGLERLLKGRTARVICTMDTPAWSYRFFFRNSGIHRVTHLILGFCGIKAKSTIFGALRFSSASKREGWLLRARKMGLIAGKR